MSDCRDQDPAASRVGGEFPWTDADGDAVRRITVQSRPYHVIYSKCGT